MPLSVDLGMTAKGAGGPFQPAIATNSPSASSRVIGIESCQSLDAVFAVDDTGKTNNTSIELVSDNGRNVAREILEAYRFTTVSCVIPI